MRYIALGLVAILAGVAALPTTSESVFFEDVLSETVVPETAFVSDSAPAPANAKWHHSRGPKMFANANFKGPSFYPGVSQTDLKQVSTKLTVSAIKVPKAWCLTLYTKASYMGVSERICGPKTMALKDLKLEHTAGATNWDGMVSSVTVQHYKFVQEKPKDQCVTSCGVQAHEFKGRVFCQRSHGLTSRHEVDSSICTGMGLSMPALPVLSCPATAFCTEWKAADSKKKCPSTKKCGFPGATIFGKVWCASRLRDADDGKLPKGVLPQKVSTGTVVKDSMCDHAFKPGTPKKDCPAADPCVKWVTVSPDKLGKKCPTNCGMQKEVLSGQLICQDKQHKTQVDVKYCKGDKPKIPTKPCPATKHCTVWKTAAPKKQCGDKKETITGTVSCTDATVGKKLSNDKCAGKKPSAPLIHCSGKALPKWVSGKPTCPTRTTCGQPEIEQTGTVHCVLKVKGKDEIQDDSACSAKKPKVETKKCAATKACPGPKAVGKKSGGMVLHKASALAGPSGALTTGTKSQTKARYQWAKKWPQQLGKSCPIKCGAVASTLTGGISCVDTTNSMDVVESHCQGEKPAVPVVGCAANPGAGICGCLKADSNGLCAGYGANTNTADFCTIEKHKDTCVGKENKMLQYPCRWKVHCEGRCMCEKTDDKGGCSGYGADAEPGFCEVADHDTCVSKANKDGQLPCRWKTVKAPGAAAPKVKAVAVLQTKPANPVKTASKAVATGNCCCSVTSYAGADFKGRLGTHTQCADGLLELPAAMKSKVTSFVMSTGCRTVKVASKSFTTSQATLSAKPERYHFTVKKDCQLG